jgi:hypothetical protein
MECPNLKQNPCSQTRNMKYISSILIAFLILVPRAHAEELQDFLKRLGTGNGTSNDLHKNFRGSVFVNGQTFEMDGNYIVQFWHDQKASNIKLVVDKFAILSKTETPNTDDKGAVISVVAETSVTEKAGNSTSKIQSVTHFIILRDPDGTFHILYVAVPKQVRSIDLSLKPNQDTTGKKPL